MYIWWYTPNPRIQIMPSLELPIEVDLPRDTVTLLFT